MIELNELEEHYELELDRVVDEIKEKKAEIVLVQFPDGFKRWATVVIDYLEEKTEGVEFIIYMEACFGACDFPVGIEHLRPKIDLIVQFGHSSLMPTY